MFFAFVIVLSNCSVPVATTEKNATLVIGTDQVNPSDSAFFARFGKKKGITIELRQLSADELLKEFKQSKYNTGIDVIIMHHLYDMRKVKRAHILQKVPKENLPKHFIHGTSNTFFGIGIDPFICVSRSDTNVSVNVYDDLAFLHYVDRLPKTAAPHFFAPFEQRMVRGKSFERIENIVKREVPDRKYLNDSVTVILTTQSRFRQQSEDSTWSDFGTVHYPNSSTSGTFHDVLTFGIVAQSSHYELALELLDWLTDRGNNARFNKLRDYDSFRNTPNYTPYRGNPEELLQYHTMIERMLRKLE